MASTTDLIEGRGGTRSLVRHWPAGGGDDGRSAGVPWASVLLVHGLGEHSGRYERVGDQLAAAGLDVAAYDQRGFGASAGRPGHIDRWSDCHDDLEERLRVVRAAAQGRPVVLYGHSLGGLIALGYVLSDRPAPDLLVLSAPAIDSTIPGWKKAVARAFARIAPTLTVANGIAGAALSRDPALGERYLADGLNRHRSTIRFGAEALAEQRRVVGALPALDVPTLVIHGGDDRLVPTASSERFAALPGVTRVVHPGLRHEVHNEPEGRVVLDGVVEWLLARIGEGADGTMRP
jgi:alpha-beta hydrolase superfamily lysophospholipase